MAIFALNLVCSFTECSCLVSHWDYNKWMDLIVTLPSRWQAVTSGRATSDKQMKGHFRKSSLNSALSQSELQKRRRRRRWLIASLCLLCCVLIAFGFWFMHEVGVAKLRVKLRRELSLKWPFSFAAHLPRTNPIFSETTSKLNGTILIAFKCFLTNKFRIELHGLIRRQANSTGGAHCIRQTTPTKHNSHWVTTI